MHFAKNSGKNNNQVFAYFEKTQVQNSPKVRFLANILLNRRQKNSGQNTKKLSLPQISNLKKIRKVPKKKPPCTYVLSTSKVVLLFCKGGSTNHCPALSIADLPLYKMDPLYYLSNYSKSHLNDMYLKLTRTELLEFAHHPSEFIVKCTIGRTINNDNYNQMMVSACDQFKNSNTYALFSPAHGVCYTFNFQGTNSSMQPLFSFYPGEEYGLRLILDIQGTLFLVILLLFSLGFINLLL